MYQCVVSTATCAFFRAYVILTPKVLAKGNGTTILNSEESAPSSNKTISDSYTVTMSDTSGTADSGNISVSTSKGNGQSAPAYTSSELRLYASNTITVSTSNSKKIAKIELLFHKQGSKDYISSISASVGSVSGGGSSTGASDTKTDTWTGSATSVTFTLGSSGQRVFEKALVYYE